MPRGKKKVSEEVAKLRAVRTVKLIGVEPCVCGHSPEDHSHSDDEQYPGSTACNEPCDCIAYEAAEPELEPPFYGTTEDI